MILVKKIPPGSQETDIAINCQLILSSSIQGSVESKIFGKNKKCCLIIILVSLGVHFLFREEESSPFPLKKWPNRPNYSRQLPLLCVHMQFISLMASQVHIFCDIDL